MQTKEQIKNWKVVASVATVAALGVSGLAVASPGDPVDTPPAIEIQDQRQGNGPGQSPTTTFGFDVVGGPSFTLDGDDSLDSPLASADFDSPDDSLDDSPDASPDNSPDDSPDTTSATTAPTSDDSPDTDDSPVDSPDDSPDDSPEDSPDSLDS